MIVPGGHLLKVGFYLRWALTQGGLLHEVGSYSRWALTKVGFQQGGHLLRVGFYKRWALNPGWLICKVDSGGLLLRVDVSRWALTIRWAFTQSGLLRWTLTLGEFLFKVGSYSGWAFIQGAFMMDFSGGGYIHAHLNWVHSSRALTQVDILYSLQLRCKAGKKCFLW